MHTGVVGVIGQHGADSLQRSGTIVVRDSVKDGATDARVSEIIGRLSGTGAKR